MSEEELDGDNLDEDDTFISCHTDLPEVVEKLRAQLLSGYTCPNHPSLNHNYQSHSLRSFLLSITLHGLIPMVL